MSVERYDEVGGREPAPDAEVHYAVAPHHPAEEEPQTLAGRAQGCIGYAADAAEQFAESVGRIEAAGGEQHYGILEVGVGGIDSMEALHEAEKVGVTAGAVEALGAVLVFAPLGAHEIVVGVRAEYLGVDKRGGLYYLLAVTPADPRGDEGRDLYVALVGIAVGKLHGVGSDEGG